MDDQAEKLDYLLAEELRIYGNLLQTCSAVADRVLCCDLDGLAEVTREQNALIMAAADTGRARAALLRSLSRSQDGEGAESGLDDRPDSALHFIPEPYASKLARHGERLHGIADELREVGQQNRFLLSYALQLVDRAVRFVYGTPESDGTYEPPGSCADRARPINGLLNKEV
jgi:flagellar biosynthesis/type III secretory pathway chaperone